MRAIAERNGWWSVALAAALAGCGSHGAATDEHDEHKEDTEAHVTVRTEPARVGVLTETADGLGRCESLPDQIATLTPAVEGHVHALLAVPGALVKKGQPLVELDKAVAAADLAEKTATRDGLKKSLTLLKSLPRAEERRANELAVEQAKVAVEQAQASVDRLRPLVVHHDVSQQQLFDTERTLKQAKIQEQTAEAQLRAMMVGPRPEAVDEAEGRIKTADALVAFSQAHLDYHTIRAPIDGVVDSLTCHPGQTIAIGALIGEVVDTRQVFATVWLPSRRRVGACRPTGTDPTRRCPGARFRRRRNCGREGRNGGQGRVRGSGRRSADRKSAGPRPRGQSAGAADHRPVDPSLHRRQRTQSRAAGPCRRRP